MNAPLRFCIFVVLLAGLLAPREAGAYPQFQLSTGRVRCSQCHVSPAGGGLLSGHGRDALTEISRDGDGDFLHGAWTPPAWLLLGGDFRGVVAVASDGGDTAPDGLWFPMQADLYTQLRAGSVSAVLTVGLRGTARGETTQRLDRLGSREHYLMWRPANQGPFVRAGRFLLPYGLRLAEHPSYTRRFGGNNTEEEPLALSGGFVTEKHELHVTGFTAAPFRCAGLGCARAGGATYYERRLGGQSAVGVEARGATFRAEQGHHDFGAGVIGKRYFENPWGLGLPVLLLGELAYEARVISNAGYTNHGLLGQLAASFFAGRGVLFTGTTEIFAADLATPDATRFAASGELQVFPWAHFELVAYTRLTDRGSMVALFLLHYTL